MPPSVSTSSALVCTRDHSLSLPPSLFPRLPQLAISLQTPDGALLVCVRISCACARVRACVNVCFKGICRLLSGRHSLTADRIGVCAYFPSQMVVFVCLSLLPFSCLGFCLGACLSNTHLSTLVCCTMYASALIFIVWLGMREGVTRSHASTTIGNVEFFQNSQIQLRFVNTASGRFCQVHAHNVH